MAIDGLDQHTSVLMSLFAWAEIWLIWLVFCERKTRLNGWLIWLIISSEQAVN
jgi:hypothetical protein